MGAESALGGVGWSPLPLLGRLHIKYETALLAGGCWCLDLLPWAPLGFGHRSGSQVLGEGEGRSGAEELASSSACGGRWGFQGPREGPVLAGGHMGPWARADQRGP